MIVGISGKKQSGKNTVALIWQLLDVWYNTEERTNFDGMMSDTQYVEYMLEDDKISYNKSSWQQKSFAHKLKQITCILLECTMEQLEDPIFKETPLGEEWWCWKIVFEGGYGTHLYPYSLPKPKNVQGLNLVKITPRMLMQIIGTEFGRDMVHPNIWITSLLADYRGDIEKWKDIKGYEGEYQISNFGKVKGLDRKIVYGNESKGDYHTKKEAILKSTVSGKYEMIKLKGNNSVTIHSLVANHFIPKIKGKSYINHIDQNPLNNFYKNLEWCTQSENIKSANEAGNGNIGTKQADVKLSEDKALLIKKLLFQGKFKQKEIAEKFGVSPTTISDIKHGRKWKHVGQENIKINPILPQKPPKWLVTDVRFPNEAKAIKDGGGILIRVDRDSDSKDSHVSENALNTYKEWDYVIDNNYSLLELILRVRQIMFKEGIIYE